MGAVVTSWVAFSDAQLLAQARAGDPAAYGHLLARHQAVAFRAAYLVCGSSAEAEDATQEACVKAWLALNRFKPDAPFRPWLVRIAINEARNRRRTGRRQTGLALRIAPDSLDAVAPSAEVEALAAEERTRLAAAIGHLRERDQLVIAARYFLGLSEAETADALRIAPGTVKSRLSRALARLQTQLEETR